MAWDIAGKTVLITGATAGIGRAGATELARRGASLAVVGRNEERMAELRDEIAAVAPESSLACFTADLADLDRVRSVADEIVAALPRIDVLVNNAGIAATSARRGPSGYDEMLTANYLGPFLLTHLLLPRLRDSAPSRIIFTASEAHRITRSIDPHRFEDLGDYRGPGAQLAYGTTKLLDLLAADELARRVDGGDVAVASFCPGLVNTGLAREVPGIDRVGRLLERTPLVRTPEQGAAMMVRLATTSEITGGDGGFHTSTPGMGLLPSRRIRQDPDAVGTTYERTCAMVGVDPVGG